ncbi:MAG: Ig-like domain-containing protein [Cocleimonas sp.]
MKNKTTTYKWAYLPFVFSSAAILATQATAAPTGSQQYRDARQVSSINHEYVGGKTQLGFGINDDGDVDVELNQVLSESENHSTGVGLWAGYDLKGDDDGVLGRGVQVNHNWVSRDNAGRAIRVNKVFAAYDRDQVGHDKATVGYGQENKNLFWEGHVSKGLSGKKDARTVGNKVVSNQAYDYGVGGSVGKFNANSNTRVRAGLDHEWSDEVAADEKDARNTTLSAGIEKFFQGTGHSVSLDVAGSRSSGGYLDGGSDDTDVTGRLGYRYDFGGASIYQPDRRYRRVRVEVPGRAIAPRYAKQTQYKRVQTFKSVPVYGKKNVRVPYKQLVKSTLELEGQTFFKLNSAKLIPSAQTRLKQIASQIRKSGYKGSIRITGNTCGLGNAQHDQVLSEKRANEVKKFLIKNGFNPNHLVSRGLGKGHPKYPNTPDQGFKNRRVDIEYVSEQKAYKTGYRNEQRNIQTGTRSVATGFKNVPAGVKNVMIDSGRPGAPRVIWKTEAIPTSPAWIKRALHNNIKHDTSVNTFETGTTIAPVIPANVAPNANNDYGTVECSGPVTINVLGNDTDPDGDTLSVISFTQPANGTVTQGVNGQLTYTSNGDYCGRDDSFTYTITDGNGHTSTATVGITVNEAIVVPEPVTPDPVAPTPVVTPDPEPVAPAPVDDTVNAENDYAVTQVNNRVTINVLKNDDSDAAITRLVSGPSHGIARIVGGQFVYTPNRNYVGIDSFTYEVKDPSGNLDQARVYVTISQADNRAPVAVNDMGSTTCDAITFDVLDNDTDPDGDALKIIGVSGANLGSTVISGSTIVYTPSSMCTTGKIGMDNFKYTISDGHGHEASAYIKVDVKGVPNNLDAEPDDVTTWIDESVVINVLDNDEGKGLRITSVDSPKNGTAMIMGGSIKYMPASGFEGTDSFWYDIVDANGNKDSALILVYVEKGYTKGNPMGDVEVLD